MLHYYYGNGKGKTSAAIGACVRAAGQNMHCIVVQFLKNGTSGEIAFLRAYPIPVLCCSFTGTKFFRDMTPSEQQAVIADHNRNLQKILNEQYDLIVLDELTDALDRHAVDPALAEQILSKTGCEIIVTGHKAHPLLMNHADYITEFRCIAHPFREGQPAREGIEF